MSNSPLSLCIDTLETYSIKFSFREDEDLYCQIGSDLKKIVEKSRIVSSRLLPGTTERFRCFQTLAEFQSICVFVELQRRGTSKDHQYPLSQLSEKDATKAFLHKFPMAPSCKARSTFWWDRVMIGLESMKGVLKLIDIGTE